MTCPECDKLQDRIAYLEGELGMARNTDVIALLSERFGIRPGPARLLQIFYNAHARVIDRYRLFDMLGCREDADVKVIEVYICQLRKGLGRDAIVTQWGQGYRLSDAGRAKVDRALEGLAPVSLGRAA